MQKGKIVCYTRLITATNKYPGWNKPWNGIPC